MASDDFGDRFPPPDKARLPADQRAVWERIEARRGRLPAPHAVLLGSPALAEAFEAMSSAFQDGVLPAVVREAVFLMAARRHGCRFLWVNHVGKARAAGLDEAAVAALGRGELPEGPAAVVAAARFDEALHRVHRVPLACFSLAVEVLGERGVVELAAFCGFAGSVALLLNVRQVGVGVGEGAPF